MSGPLSALAAMLRYTLKRLLMAIPLLVGVATLTFVVIRMAPGDPMDMFVEQAARRGMSEENIEVMRERLGLNEPLPVQYGRWLGQLAQGDLGESFRYRRPVADLMWERVPFTLQLTVLALLVDMMLGITLGIIAAVKQYSLWDRVVTLGSLVVYSIPGFWLALMLVLVFSVELGWFPTSLTRSIGYDLMSPGGKIWDRILHLVLPVFVLGVASAAGTARYMRNRLLEVLSEEYILAARARGLRERAVILRHALRNALIPIITIYGMALPFLLGGSVLIESVFAWPGMGTLAVEAVGGRDYPVILATTMLSAALVILGNLLADLGYAVVDPRVSYDGGVADG